MVPALSGLIEKVGCSLPHAVQYSQIYVQGRHIAQCMENCRYGQRPVITAELNHAPRYTACASQHFDPRAGVEEARPYGLLESSGISLSHTPPGRHHPLASSLNKFMGKDIRYQRFRVPVSEKSERSG